MHEKITHACYFFPRGFKVFFAKVKRQHVGSLANNHQIIDDCMIAHAVCNKLFQSGITYIYMRMLSMACKISANRLGSLVLSLID